jgi:uncharacterized membrane protein YkvA (DUF1232 family)
MTTRTLAGWKARARQLKTETYALYLAYRHPAVPWYAKVWAACVVAYAFSPIDLIPDPIPIVGYLDDLVLVPLGVTLALKLIPPQVMAECRARAQAADEESTNWIAAAVIVAIWIGLAALAFALVWRIIR